MGLNFVVGYLKSRNDCFKGRKICCKKIIAYDKKMID